MPGRPDQGQGRRRQNAGLDATVTAFPHTVVEMPLHGQFTYPVAGGQKGTWADGIGLANAWDAKYGSRVISRLRLGPGDWTAAASSLATARRNLYSWMHKRADLGRPIAFQATLAPVSGRGQHDADRGRGPRGDDEAVGMGARWFEHASWAYFTVDEGRGLRRRPQGQREVVLGSVGHRPPASRRGADAVRDPSGIPEHLPPQVTAT